MNILLLAPWLPWPPHDGARIRILETVRFLSGRHRVVLVAPTYSAGERDLASRLESGGIDVHAVPVPDGGLARLSRLCKGVLSGKPPIQAFHRNSAIARQISKLTTAIAFDIVQIEFSFLSHYLQAVRGSSRPRTILSMHNVESLRFERELQFSAWNARRLVVLADRYLFPNWEPRAVQSFDGVVAVSEAEAAWISHHAPRVQVKIVPNGVDVDFFRPQSAAGTSSNVVFTGSMDYPPNIDAALWFADVILPIARQSTTAACVLSLRVVDRRPKFGLWALAPESRSRERWTTSARISPTPWLWSYRCGLAGARGSRSFRRWQWRAPSYLRHSARKVSASRLGSISCSPIARRHLQRVS